LKNAGDKLDKKTEASVIKNVEDMIKDIAGDNKIDVHNLTEEQMREMHLSPEQIEEIERLEDVLHGIEDHTMNVNQVIENLDEVKEQMQETEKKLEAQKDGFMGGDLASERKVEIDILKDVVQ